MNHEKGEITLWSLPSQDVFKHLESSEKGLTGAEADLRLKKLGYNEIAKKDKRYGLEIYLSQFKSPLVLVLIAAAIISYFLEQRIDSAVILSIVFINSLLGFFQEYKAEHAVRELKKYVTLKSKVLRNGEIVEIESREIVPGDIVYLNIGDVIPADIRLLHVQNLTTDESPLTGESVPVLKKVTIISEKHSLPQYLHNVAFMGTSVASGSGYGVVIATGESTFFGKTAAYLKQKTPEADFQKNIKKFSNFLLKVILVMTLFIFIVNAFLGRNIFESFLFALALAVGITPEVLPVIMTITLSNGALKMAKEKVITKRLVSVEDFGNIDTLCCDKTGTLTEGVLSLRHFFNLDGKKDEKILLYGLLCNSSKSRRFDNPIDKAIMNSEDAASLSEDLKDYEILSENDFDFQRRRMSALVKGNNGNFLIAKGAPESMFKVCRYAKINGRMVSLNADIIAKLHAKVIGYEKDGHRVIAIAEKSIKKNESAKEDEKELTLTGFMLFLDPPKKGVKESLQTLQNLGVGIKIISGDSPIVTRKICTDVGLQITENRVITGDELEKLNDVELQDYCKRYNVFARVNPEQKYRIVVNLNKEGHIVGFLGDGINDAPALKAADVGISVDSATGIAKEAADIILLEKDLGVLAHGIMDGRKTFGNITKYILNTISANYGNMFTVAISSFFISFIPLLPSQILLTNFVTDAPLLSISTDNVDPQFLKKPKKWNIKLISRFMIWFGVISSIFDLALILPLIFIVKANPELFRTSWFALSVLSELVVTFAIRTTLPFFKSKPSNALLIVSLLAALIGIGVTYTYLGSRFFEFVHMPVGILMLIGGIVVTYFVTAELAKRFFFKKFEI